MSAPDIRTRLEFGWSKVPGPASRPVSRTNTNMGMVAHYDSANQGLAKKPHTACISYWVNTRVFHVKTRGWSDIGYSYGVCPHGEIFEGRGFGYQQAAQVQQGNGMPNGNSRWVSCTFMSGPTEEPTPEQLGAWARLRAWLMDAHGLASAVKRHKDFSQTDCPGKILSELVTNGTLGKAPTDIGTDDMALPLIRKGSEGFDVKTLRYLLGARGFVPVEVVPDSALRGWLDSAKFDDALERIVIGFQNAKDLDADGIVGPKTWAKLSRQ